MFTATVNSCAIYIADTGNDRVQVPAASGKVIGIIGAGLSTPADLLLDETGRTAGILYLANSGTGLVE